MEDIMSDSDIILNNLGLSDSSWGTAQDGSFGIQALPSGIVDIKINGISISSFTGPTPLMDMSRTYENDDGYLSTIVESVNLNGKIIPHTTGTGFVPIMNAISGLKSLISQCPINTLEVTCNGVITYKATGMIVKNFSANKTDNNWTKTADFSIDLEQKIDASGNLKTVVDKAESWTIEPLEDATYVSFNQPLSGLSSEYLSPDLKPTAPTRDSPQPGTTVNGGQLGNGTSLGINTRGQYRITRRLSARGLALAVGTGICSNDQDSINLIKLNNAKKWVDERASGISSNGAIVIPSLASSSAIGAGIHLYNHSRSLSTDIFNGTYEITDNWIAMPTGTQHTESFTIDASTSNNFTKTIRVAGSINGLAMYNHDAHTNKSLLVPSGSGLTVDMYIASGNVNKSGTLPAHSPSSIGGSTGGAANSTATTLHPHKYSNAKDAWEKEIKPYLYRRACLGMSQYGKANRQPANEVDPSKPESPAFFADRPLNTIPVSTTEGHDPIKGLINYNYEFNNQYRAISGVISENINITHDAPADNIAETTVLGRYLGPIIQSIGRTNARKSITIDIVVQPPQSVIGSIPNSTLCPVGLNTDLRNYIQDLIDGHAPFYPRDVSVFGGSARTAQVGTVFVQSDQETWNPTEGRFSKTVSWIYQQCSVGKHWLNY
jgi:hypothetical protein